MSLVMGSLERAIVTLSHNAVLDLDAKRSQLGYDQMQELEHQFQIPIEGVATTNLTWSWVDIPFDVEFFFAPQQRDSPLTVPHMGHGSAVHGETDDPNNPYGLVAIHATVIGWAEDVAREAITGCRLGIGVVCGGPTPTTTVDFHGYLHLTFQGYGQIGGADGGDNNVALNVGT